jgi:hypothetical protein
VRRLTDWRRWPVAFRRLLGLFALFSGLALLMNIIASVSLPLALAGTAVVLFGGFGLALAGQDAESRRWTLRTAAVGVVVGLTATAGYDVTKGILSTLDPSPYNPFEALRIFGQLLLGTESKAVGVYVVGGLFHFLNGTAFAVAYCFLFARDGRASLRRALLTGMAWGVFLETFQLTLYPGWLNIQFYAEFATISALSHLVYGATVGLLARAGLRRFIASD